ncbi:hypothetical protein [Streptomyces sp. NPDC000851]
MARKMTKAPTHAWRAVIVTRSGDGPERTEYLGPYWRKADATSRITNQRRQYSQSWSYRKFVNGWVESAPLGDWTKED